MEKSYKSPRIEVINIEIEDAVLNSSGESGGSSTTNYILSNTLENSTLLNIFN